MDEPNFEDLKRGEGKTQLNTGENYNSKIDSWLGNHTDSVLILIIFAALLSCLMYIIRNKIENQIGLETSFIGLLTGIIGFYAGKQKSG